MAKGDHLTENTCERVLLDRLCQPEASQSQDHLGPTVHTLDYTVSSKAGKPIVNWLPRLITLSIRT